MSPNESKKLYYVVRIIYIVFELSIILTNSLLNYLNVGYNRH